MKCILIMILLITPIISKESTVEKRDMMAIVAERELYEKKHLLLIGVMHQETRLGKVTVSPMSKREGAVGVLQIRKGMVEFINNNLNKKFTLADRRDSTKSVEMFLLYQEMINPSFNIDFGCHIWNAGHNNVKNRWHLTEKYRNDVKAYLSLHYRFKV